MKTREKICYNTKCNRNKHNMCNKPVKSVKTKVIDGNISINYQWWRSDRKPIISSHIQTLKTIAFNRIIDMIQTGYYNGELTTNIENTDSEFKLICYKGYWNLLDNNE